jgi:hypothetical protein
MTFKMDEAFKERQFELCVKIWDRLTPEVRASVWYHLTGKHETAIGDSQSSMGAQAVADYVANAMSPETLVDMERNVARVKNGKV